MLVPLSKGFLFSLNVEINSSESSEFTTPTHSLFPDSLLSLPKEEKTGYVISFTFLAPK